jgi:hypothetical protein
MRLATIMLLLCSLPACTSEQWYAIGQNYQRNQCDRLPDMAERQRCLEKADMSHDQYRKETGAGNN